MPFQQENHSATTRKGCAYSCAKQKDPTTVSTWRTKGGLKKMLQICNSGVEKSNAGGKLNPSPVVGISSDEELQLQPPVGLASDSIAQFAIVDCNCFSLAKNIGMLSSRRNSSDRDHDSK